MTDDMFIEEVRCIGGPLDGKVLTNIDSTIRDYEIAVPTRHVDIDFLSPWMQTLVEPEPLKKTRYSLETYEDYDTTVYLFVHESVDIGEVLTMLINGYVPQKPDDELACF